MADDARRKWIEAYFDEDGDGYGKPRNAINLRKANEAYNAQLATSQSNSQKANDERELSAEEIEQQYALFEEEARAGVPLAPTFDTMPLRMVKNLAANIAAGARINYRSSFHAPQLESDDLKYDGNNLVDENGLVTKLTRYDTSGGETAEGFLYGIVDESKRKQFLLDLQSHSYYGNGKVSSLALSGGGFQDSDRGAVNEYLNAASARGLTGMAFYPEMRGSPSTYTGSGGGATAYFPSREDSESNLRRESFKILGRALTTEEMKAAIQRIKAVSMARTGKSGGEQAPSLAAIAAKQVEKTAPVDAGAYTLGSAMDRIFKTLGA